jgi:two-component system, OmpR family, phosphate regulon sensor histidine kinase PhoR
MGIRTRLFLVSIVLMAVLGVTSGLVMEVELRRWLERQIASDLTIQAHAAGLLVSAQGAQGSADALQALSKAGGSRLTIVGGDGVVLLDTAVSDDRLQALENHGARPEVLAARATGVGTARRTSGSVGIPSFYVAVRAPMPGDSDRVSRASKPLAEVDDTVRRLRQMLLVAGATGLVTAGLMSVLASHLATSRLRGLLDRVVRLSGQLPDGARDDLSTLVGGFDFMSTQLAAAVAASRDHSERLEAVLAGMQAGVIAIDSNLRVQLVNPAARSMLHLEGVVTRHDLLALTRRPGLVSLAEAAVGGQSGVAEVESVQGQVDASTQRLLVTATPQAQSGAVLVLHDVTELRRLETVRRDFVANVAHELRTPVSVLQVNAEALVEGGLDDPASSRAMAEALHRGATRLSALVADLLQLSRIEAGKERWVTSSVVLRPTVEQVVADLSARMDTQAQRVTVDVPASVSVRGDQRAIEQILVNLLENANRYAGRGAHVTISARHGEGSVRLIIEDDGPGIAAGHHERVFERFYRVDGGRTRESGGTGLGLSIVKHLVEAMDGSVHVEDRDPHGARFVVNLRGNRASPPS